MGNRMERVRDAEIGVGSDGLLRCDSQSRHAREIGLIRQRQQVEHDVDLLVDFGRYAHGRIGHGDSGEILGDHVLNLPLDVAHRSQIVVHAAAVRRAESLLKPLRLRLDTVENAAGALENRGALAKRVAGPEQSVEELARVVLHRQHLVGRSKRVPSDVQIGLRRELEARERGVAARSRARRSDRSTFPRSVRHEPRRLSATPARTICGRRRLDLPGRDCATPKSPSSDRGMARAASAPAKSRSCAPRLPASTN